VLRELPFTARKYLHDFDPAAAAAWPTETILLQGIIDLVIDEGASATVIDYKTDRITGARRLRERTEVHRLQIEQYARSLQAIWQLERVRAALAFVDARELVWIDP
jgi:ATP-dependent helicase/nuclease subunit A